jgi:trans-2-enoyl-CoA reductase
LETFESGNFAFGADASAVAITAAAEAGAGTTGASTEASVDSSNAGTGGGYINGMAVFTVAKGGLMYAATISGQKFSYTPKVGD